MDFFTRFRNVITRRQSCHYVVHKIIQCIFTFIHYDEVGDEGPDVRSFSQTQVTFSAGSSAGQISDRLVHVVILDDDIFEQTEYFTVSLNPSPAQRLSTVQGRDVANVTILDDDGEPGNMVYYTSWQTLNNSL